MLRMALSICIAANCAFALAADPAPPNAGRGAGTVPIWNPHKPTPTNPPLTIRVLVLNYDPLVPSEGHKHLSEVFKWNNPCKMAQEYKEAMEYATGGYLRFDIVEWRNLNEIYAQENGERYTIEEYVRNRRTGKGWRTKGAMADYPRLLHEQNVEPLIDMGIVDEVWIFSDHYFGLWEASMAGPGAFFINGGVYPKVQTRRPFAFYGFNYERGVAEMMHNTAHRTEATMNRVYGKWNLKNPKNNWEKFSANHDQSDGLAGVGTCHWPPNAKGDYDYGSKRVVTSWADAYLTYPKLDFIRKEVSRDTWSKGPDHHLDYMKWYFAHIPRADGVNEDGRQNNWLKYIFDFQSYDARGKPLPASVELLTQNVGDSKRPELYLSLIFRGADQIDLTSMNDDDLSVIGRDKKPMSVGKPTFPDLSNRSYQFSSYAIAPHGGSFDQTPPGEYTVTLRANRIRTRSGETLPGKELGTFRVLGDADVGELTIEAPKEPILLGAHAIARAFLQTKDGTKKEVTREIRWRTSDSMVAGVSTNLHSYRGGIATLSAKYGKRTASTDIKVFDPGLPTTNLVNMPIAKANDAKPATIVIEYQDPDGIQRESLGLGDVRVHGPGEYHRFAEFVSAEPLKNSTDFTATYRVAAPDGGWRRVVGETYSIEITAFQVADKKGNCVPGKTVGQFSPER